MAPPRWRADGLCRSRFRLTVDHAGRGPKQHEAAEASRHSPGELLKKPWAASVGGDQAQGLRARHGLGAPFNAQLGEHALEMCLHGLGTDIEATSNFLVRHSLSDQFEDVGFTGA